MYSSVYGIHAVSAFWYLMTLPIDLCKLPYLLLTHKSIKTYYHNKAIINKVRRQAGFVFTKFDINNDKDLVQLEYKVYDRYIAVRIRFDCKCDSKTYEHFRECCQHSTGMHVTDYVNQKGMMCFKLYDHFPPLNQSICTGTSVTIGTDINGLYYWRYDTYAHMLIVGPTGQGKTNTIMYLLHGLFTQDNDIYAIDGKGTGYYDYEDKFKSYLCFNNENYDDVLQAIEYFEDIMVKRYSYMREHKIKHLSQTSYKRAFLLIEEHSSIIDGAPKKIKEKMMSHLANIGRLGRECGCQLIFVMQRPDTVYISGDLRSNLNCKVVLGAGDKQCYSMAFDNTDFKPLMVGQAWIKQGNDIRIISIPDYEEIKQ